MRCKGCRGAFYPRDLAQKRELAYAASIFPTIEINGTFYSLQRPESFPHWASQTPDDFVFAIKGSRYLTHVLRLREIRKPLANFFGSGLLRLGHKLGPILWQFPPNLRFDPRRMEFFFKLLHGILSRRRNLPGVTTNGFPADRGCECTKITRFGTPSKSGTTVFFGPTSFICFARTEPLWFVRTRSNGRDEWM